jgi:hypothetical protein
MTTECHNIFANKIKPLNLSKMENGKIALSEMIEMLREEIASAQRKGKNSTHKFLVESIELELSLEISRKGTGKGGVKFWVVEAGAEYEHANSTIQKCKLTLRPGSSGPLEVSAKSDGEMSRK